MPYFSPGSDRWRSNHGLIIAQETLSMFMQLIRGVALWLVAGVAFAAPASTDLKTALGHIAEQARPGTMGIAVMNVADGRVVKVSGNRSYLMMSAFKAPIAAAVLARVDSGELKLDQRVRLVPGDVVPGSAVPSLGDQLKAGALDVSVEALLRAAVTQSDNTAADALLRLLGGGAVATHFLQSKGIAGMRIDMGERELGQRLNGFRSTEPSPARESALAAEQREKRGFEAVLASKVNTTTLDGAVAFLDKLQSGRLLSTSSTRMLLGMMTAQIIPNRLRSGLPAGFQLADKTGTDVTYQDRLGAWNDMGIITTPDGRRVIVAIFLSDSLATPKQADAWFAEIGRLVAASMH